MEQIYIGEMGCADTGVNGYALLHPRGPPARLVCGLMLNRVGVIDYVCDVAQRSATEVSNGILLPAESAFRGLFRASRMAETEFEGLVALVRRTGVYVVEDSRGPSGLSAVRMYRRPFSGKP